MLDDANEELDVVMDADELTSETEAGPEAARGIDSDIDAEVDVKSPSDELWRSKSKDDGRTVETNSELVCDGGADEVKGELSCEITLLLSDDKRLVGKMFRVSVDADELLELSLNDEVTGAAIDGVTGDSAIDVLLDNVSGPELEAIDEDMVPDKVLELNECLLEVLELDADGGGKARTFPPQTPLLVLIGPAAVFM